jgi:hypothetical protein
MGDRIAMSFVVSAAIIVGSIALLVLATVLRVVVDLMK